MIKNLHICNYALIDEIDIDFGAGFNIITGETGAGKSIMLGALSLLLGGRADSRVIRSGERKSVIEGVFTTLDAPFDIEKVLAANDLDQTEGDEIILRRELSPGGRSRAFVNDTPVTLPVLREIAERLVDIHSQHENQLLTQPSYQLGIIDNLAKNADLLAKYHEAFNTFRKALKAYTDTRDLIRRNRDDAEFLQFQYQQLDAMNLQPGERHALEQEREILSNVGDIKQKLSEALDPLANLQENVLAMIARAANALRLLGERLGESDAEPDYDALADRLETAAIEITDIADTLADADNTLGADPGRLEEVEERLSALYSLELKHHVDSTDQLIALRDRLAQQINALDNADATLQQLELVAKKAKKAAMELAETLSQSRMKAAQKFASELFEKASPLGMANLRVEITLAKEKLGPDGFDRIQFLVAFNKNQVLMPIGGTASGGEISRLMLAVKSIVAQNMQLPSIIFDEVDTGVSGDIAGRMGALMAQMGKYQQVIAITHLPGVAALGDIHFKVYKEDSDTATNTRIRRLADNERDAEIALMISGSATDEAALANARALLSKKL